MKFKSSQIQGKGRGKMLGFPTINLQIPNPFELTDGIYAVKVFAEDKEFKGALHYGPIPAFKETDKTLEFFLIDVEETEIPGTIFFEVDVIKFIRPVLNFSSKEELSSQIQKDVEETKKILNSL